VLAILAIVLATVQGRAQEAELRDAALIVRVLSYDRALTARAGGNVVVLVAFKQGDSASETERQRLVAALNSVGARTPIAGMRPRATEHAFRDTATLQRAARDAHAVAVYSCRGLEGSADAISRATRGAQALSITSEAASVRAGLGVGLIHRSGQVRLMINLPATVAEGARLDAALLQVAEVIR
jgi:hypothetical protein